jgi:hypothetical protein
VSEQPLYERLWQRFVAPQPLARLELLRIILPLAILGFLSSRIVHVDDWIGTAGFHIPDLGRGDDRQPIYLAPLAPFAARALCGVLVASGLALSAGAFARVAAPVFALTLAWVTLIDRMAAFTVSKLGVVLALALAASPVGSRWAVDAWRRHRPPATLVSAGYVRGFQLLVVCFYLASGVCKARGDWLSRGDVIWSQMHDSYQTVIAYEMGRLMPAWSWGVFQATTLAYEALAPLWFGLRPTRPFALAYGVTMHLMIGLMFGPLLWFSLLMIGLLVAGFAPLPARSSPPGEVEAAPPPPAPPPPAPPAKKAARLR